MRPSALGSFNRFLILFTLLPLAAACGPAGSNSGSDSRSNGTVPLPPDRTEAAPVVAPDEALRPASGQVWVIFGSDTITAEVARTADQREQGLMNRTELAENAGMLFMFEAARERSFWMSNTLVALDIAYMDAQFRIFTIKPMEPMSEELVESDGAAQYALEVNQGWFADHGVQVGAQPELIFGR